MRPAKPAPRAMLLWRRQPDKLRRRLNHGGRSRNVCSCFCLHNVRLLPAHYISYQFIRKQNTSSDLPPVMFILALFPTLRRQSSGIMIRCADRIASLRELVLSEFVATSLFNGFVFPGAKLHPLLITPSLLDVFDTLDKSRPKNFLPLRYLAPDFFNGSF